VIVVFFILYCDTVSDICSVLFIIFIVHLYCDTVSDVCSVFRLFV
jgi:hypothetical protein